MPELLKLYLSELACQDGSDIQSNEVEIYGETEEGGDGVQTVKITDVAEMAHNRIIALEKTLMRQAKYPTIEAMERDINIKCS